MKIEFRTDAPRLLAPVGRTVRGYAAVFNSLSEDLGGFREVIRPGAFAGALGDDVRALINHDENLILGRTKAGTLSLAEDQRGLAIAIDLPDTTYANDLRIAMARGDVSQMSFGFVVGTDAWRTEGATQIREVVSVKKLFDVSVVTFPAYQATEATLRTAERIAAERVAAERWLLAELGR